MGRRLFLLSGPVLALLVVVVCTLRTWKPTPRGPEGEAMKTEQFLYRCLARDRMVNCKGYAIFVKNVEGKKLVHAVVKLRDAAGRIFVVRAKDGDLSVKPGKKVLCVHLRQGQYTSSDGSGRFDDRSWEVPLPDAREE